MSSSRPASARARPRPAPRGVDRGDRASRADRAATTDRRRRERHLRRRRRDLLLDIAIAFLLTIVALIMTAGLGVIALLEVPVGGAVIGSFVLERSVRKRRRRAAAAATPPGRKRRTRSAGSDAI